MIPKESYNIAPTERNRIDKKEKTMNENPHESPEPVDETREAMKAVHRGLWWVMAGLLFFVLLILTPILNIPPALYLTLMLLTYTTPLMQLWGMWKCLRCPESVMPHGKALIYAGGIFYLAAFVFLMPVYADSIPNDKCVVYPYAWLLEFVMLCFFLSGVIWQIFLLLLARKLNSRRLTISVWLMFAAWLLFAACLRPTYPAVVVMMLDSGWEAGITWFIYMMIYLTVHIGLRRKIKKTIHSGEK